MSEKEWIEINRFEAKSEDGQIYTIVELALIVTQEMGDGTISRKPSGKKDRRTLEGNYSVKKIDENTFELQEIDVRVKTL